MADHPHEDGIQLLYGATEMHPSVVVVHGPEGPQLQARSAGGDHDEAVQSHLRMLATHIHWFADQTNVPVEKVVEDALTEARRIDDDERVETEQWSGSRESQGSEDEADE